MLRLAFVIENLGIHGGVRRCIELANALVMRGHIVTIYSQRGEKCEWLPQLARARAWADAAKEKPQHIMVMFSVSRAAHNAALALKAPVNALYCVGVNALALEQITTEPSVFRAVVENPAWRVFACSTWIAEWIEATWKRPVIPLLGAVNRTIFHPRRVKRDPAHPVWLTGGDIREREGTVCVRKAYEIAARQVKGLTWATYHRKGYDQNKLADVYNTASVCVDGQWYAGWNNFVAEAMACGRPVVCTDIGGVRDFAVHEETALLVPREEPEVMAAAAVRLLTDADLAQRLRLLALERIGQWSYAGMAARFERVLRQYVD